MATIKIKRGTSDPTAAQVTNSGELAANTSTPKIFLKTADDGTTTPIWVGAEIEASPGDWTSATKLATQSAINTTFMPKGGGTFTGVVNFGQGATAPGEIRLLEDTDDGANYSAFRGSARAANITYLMPTTDPTSGQILSAGAPSSNVSQLSWADASSATTVSTTSDNTNVTRYLVFSTSAGSGKTLYVDDTTGVLSYNPSVGTVITTNLSLSGSTGVVTSNIYNSYGIDGNLTITSFGSDTGASITLTGSPAAASVGTISASTINLNGAIATNGSSFELPTTYTFGDSSTASTTLNIQTGATANLGTKAINIGTGGAAGSTTNISLGSSNGGTVTVNKDLVVSGNFTVNGTTTTVNSTTLSVDDKNIVLGADNTLDSAADGGGITLKGASDKTFNWVDATDAWTSSEHLNLLTGKAYYINGTSVLSSNTLGSGVTASSLTSVGTIGTGTWEATDVGLSHGGTNASLTAVDGGIVYSTASAMAISAAGTSGQVLTSAGAAAPTWTSQSSLSVGTATTATNVGLTEATSSDNTALYLTFAASGASGALKIDATAQAGLSVLSYVPSTGVLTAYKVEAIVDGGTY
jgi:hypothetical protein